MDIYVCEFMHIYKILVKMCKQTHRKRNTKIQSCTHTYQQTQNMTPIQTYKKEKDRDACLIHKKELIQLIPLPPHPHL